MTELSVSLLEHLETLVRHERESRLAYEGAADKALVLQAAEYERRLTVLNGEHLRIREILTTTVSRERYEEYVIRHGEWGAEVGAANEKRFRFLEDAQSLERGARGRQAAIWASVLAILALLLKFVPVGFGFTQ